MSKDLNELLSGLPAWELALQEDGYIDEDNRVTIKEAFASPDAPFLFPKIISRTLREAAEPQFLVTPLLSTVRLGKGRSLEFPAVNAIQAAEIPEGQEYPEQALAIAKQREGKVSKKGVKLAFTEEVVADSLWDIVGMHVRAAGRAMARLKEQIALSRFRGAATVAFDGDGGDAIYGSLTGLDAYGAENGSLSWDDTLDMAAVLMAENHIVTDFIVHPLMWAVFLKNQTFNHGGVQNSGVWGQNPSNPSATLNRTAPFGVNVIVTPFVSFTARDDDTGEPAKSDVFLIDRNEIGSMLVKDGMSTDEWDDFTRDIRYLKLKERYDIVMHGDGEGIAVAKNVALERSYDVTLTREAPPAA